MGDPKGFLTINRKEGGYRTVADRILDFGEVEQTLNQEDRRLQAGRCMDCGVPFCHWACPACSKIPEWQDSLFKGKWREAYQILFSSNVFPDITGRVCPAPCEKSCVLAIQEQAVTIRENECAATESAFALGLIRANPPKIRTGRKAAVVGSGPAGLSAALLLNQAGHTVTVFEKDDAVGGLLRYGIPDFKLSKSVIDRRISFMEEEGIQFQTNTCAGKEIGKDELMRQFETVILAVGAGQPRNLEVPGRQFSGIYFALDYLKQQNKTVAGRLIPEAERIDAKGKKVVVIGGGDTGSDCVGTAIRQKAESVTQIEILPKPPEKRREENPWPYWPEVLRTSSSHLEGCERRWGLSTTKFSGRNGIVKQVETVKVEQVKNDKGAWMPRKIPGTTEIFEADLVLLALGFTGPVHEGLLNTLGVAFDIKGNVMTDHRKMSSVKGIFAAGDMEKGAGLVVHAIEAGKNAALHADAYLLHLPFKT